MTTDNYYKLKKKFKTDLNEYEVFTIVIRKHNKFEDLIKVGLFIEGTEVKHKDWYLPEGIWKEQLDVLALKTIEEHEDWELIEAW